MRNRIAAAVLGVAMIGVPVAAQAKDTNGQAGYQRAISHALENGDYKPYEKRYLRLYDRYAEEFGLEAIGRNIVIFGLNTEDGPKEAPRAEVVVDAEMMAAALNPAPVETTEATTTEATTTAPSSVVECESGGDYGAVNPAGYYGAYQFDQQTWDAYAPSGYAGTNPASAPPSVQDQAAASVDYDAWPNC